MRYLTILVVALAVLYGGYWFIGRAAVENAGQSFLDDLAQDGWTVSHTDLSTTGFPSRFDTTITDLSLTHPVNGITWATPLFQVFALSYRPHKVIAIWPAQQVITLPDERLTITADGLRASGGVNIALSLPLDAITLESGPMVIASNRGYEIGLEKLLFAFRSAGPGPADYDVFFEATGLAPPAALIAMIDPAAALPAALDRLHLDAHVVLDQPIDRNLRGQVRVAALTLRDTRLVWGDIEVTASGGLTVGTDGVPEGTINLAAGNWQQVITLAVSAGLIPTGVGSLMQRAGTVVAGGTDRIEAPLIFADGIMSLGPIQIGPAPRFF